MKNKSKNFNYVPDSRGLIVLREPHSPISEQYRAIRTNILFSQDAGECLSVLFTSDMPSAGKSTTVANVAVVFAKTGKKTLIIDADLRRPTGHYTFEVANQSGLSTALVNDVDVNEIIKETRVKSLDIITSGPIPPNPSELLSKRKMTVLIEELKALYDIILIDSPPIVPVIDAQVLSKLVDGSVIVTNVEENDWKTLQEAKQLIEKGNENIFGVVLNKKKNIQGDNSYYQYGRGG